MTSYPNSIHTGDLGHVGFAMPVNGLVRTSSLGALLPTAMPMSAQKSVQTSALDIVTPVLRDESVRTDLAASAAFQTAASTTPGTSAGSPPT